MITYLHCHFFSFFRVDMASMQATDLWNEFDKLCYGDNFV